jgi:hypothetical protein
MTATVTQVAIDNLPGTPGQALSSAAGGIVIAFLLALMVVRLMIVVADPERGRQARIVVDLAIAPLLAASIMLMVGRLLEIQPIG